MKFKKFLGAVCSFLLATTSLLCGGPASAKDDMGENFCVFMVNSGEDLGDGKCDGDECDKACWGTIADATNLFIYDKMVGYKFKYSGCNVCINLILNQKCQTAVQAMGEMTLFDAPDVVVVVANLAKNRDEVIADLKKHLDQILECQKKSVLYSGNTFELGLCGEEVYLNTVPVVIDAFVPEGMKQLTSKKEFVEIAEQIKRQRNGEFENIHNNVYVRQSDGTHICINMNDKSTILHVDDFYQDLENIANDASLQPTPWEDYRNGELPSREEKAEAEAIREEKAEDEGLPPSKSRMAELPPMKAKPKYEGGSKPHLMAKLS